MDGIVRTGGAIGSNVVRERIGEEREEGRINAFQKKLEAAAKERDDVGLREAAREFESFFIGMMLKQMRKTVIDGGLIEKSEARRQFETMLDDTYAQRMSEGNGIGLGETIYEAMKHAYGV